MRDLRCGHVEIGETVAALVGGCQDARVTSKQQRPK